MFKYVFETKFSESEKTFEQPVYADSEAQAWLKLAERNVMYKEYGYPVKIVLRGIDTN